MNIVLQFTVEGNSIGGTSKLGNRKSYWKHTNYLYSISYTFSIIFLVVKFLLYLRNMMTKYIDSTLYERWQICFAINQI
jgi:hypothetical protein